MTTTTALVEQARIELWRFERLRAADCPTATAITLATCQDVDLHRAVDLLTDGCPPKTALSILL
jgi:hypothetical protein